MRTKKRLQHVLTFIDSEIKTAMKYRKFLQKIHLNLASFYNHEK